MFSNGQRNVRLKVVSAKSQQQLTKKIEYICSLYATWDCFYDESPHKSNNGMYCATLRFIRK